jgi:hypothetical protein
MPILQNARHEVFAQSRAKGARLEDAYEDAGFIPGNGHAGKLAQRPDVFERIAELRVEQAHLGDASPGAVIAALLRVAKASENLATPAGVKEARLTLLEVSRLSEALAAARRIERLPKPYNSFNP